MAELDGLEHDVLGDLLGPRLDHDDLVLRADDDQVEPACIGLGHERVEHELAVDIADIDGAHRPVEGYFGHVKAG